MNLLVLGVFDRVLLERFVRLGLLTNIVSQRRKRRASETILWDVVDKERNAVARRGGRRVRRVIRRNRDCQRVAAAALEDNRNKVPRRAPTG